MLCCMDMFNCNDVDTMLIKRRQKFFDGYEHLDNLLCQKTMSCKCIIRLIIILIIIFCFVLLSYYFFCCIAISMTK